MEAREYIKKYTAVACSGVGLWTPDGARNERTLPELVEAREYIKKYTAVACSGVSLICKYYYQPWLARVRHGPMRASLGDGLKQVTKRPSAADPSCSI